MAYLWLKLFHIILAILSVGFGASYGLLVARGRAAGRGELAFALRTIQAMDRIATAGYVLLLVTGMGLVHLSGLSMRGGAPGESAYGAHADPEIRRGISRLA